MSSQNDSGVPIIIASKHEQSHFRLMELPPDLLNLLTSDNAPTLRLKSKEVEDGNTKDANVVLCTPDKTYRIRQVSTSNSVYVTRPREVPSNNGSGLPQLGVEAISRCDSTIELLPSSPSSAAGCIRAVLPVFLSTGKFSAQESISKHQLFTGIPLSEAECQQGWAELSCFESVDPAGCFVPSALVRIQAWQAILVTATAAGIDLTTAYPSIGLPHYLVDLEIDWPKSLLTAILRSVSVHDADGELAVNEEKCVRFVGLAQLESQSEGHPIKTPDFIDRWKDLVPEKWREKCQLSILEGLYTLNNDANTITCSSNLDSSKSNPNSSSTPATTASKRKWHEKFRPTKPS